MGWQGDGVFFVCLNEHPKPDETPMISMRSFLLYSGLALTAACWGQTALAAGGPPALNFTVLRDGEAVGHHAVSFQPTPDGLKVQVDTQVVVKMAMIPVYRFEHHDEEVWQGGHLVGLASATNDDGTRHGVRAAAGADGLRVEGDGVASRLPAGTVPASLWNRDTIGQSGLMNTLDGHLMDVAVSDLGPDEVSVHGQPRPARHYRVAGELNRELWYDGAGTLVQVRFKAKDNSDIRYVLQ